MSEIWPKDEKRMPTLWAPIFALACSTTSSANRSRYSRVSAAASLLRLCSGNGIWRLWTLPKATDGSIADDRVGTRRFYSQVLRQYHIPPNCYGFAAQRVTR
jgi:hypothetical protein